MQPLNESIDHCRTAMSFGSQIVQVRTEYLESLVHNAIRMSKSPAGGVNRVDAIYPTIYALVDREAAQAIEVLAHYVRPDGDWVLCRSHLDEIDRGLQQIEQILCHKWNGQTWSVR